MCTLCQKRIRAAKRENTSGNRPLRKGAQSGDRFAHDQSVHFACALIRINCLSVGDKAAHMIVQENAVAAEQFARIADGLAAFDSAICFSPAMRARRS